jgi:phosphoribosylaminoimidazolecarboxamide formyltransferase / IMP cyclohydrolase
MPKHALISVYHKEGIADFAQALVKRGWNVLASGGTALELARHNVPVRDIGTLVGEPILGHRVVTLSREIHAGILARDTEEDRLELERLGIPRIDMVCVDLYPLEEEIEKPGATRESVIEKTDIGGPTLLRAAVKGERIVVCDSNDYLYILYALDFGLFNTDRILVDKLAAKAEALVARYCLRSAQYRSGGELDGFVGTLESPWKVIVVQ